MPALTLRLRWIAAFTLALIALFLPFRLAAAGAVQALAPVTEADAHLGFCNVLPGAPSAAGSATWAQLAFNAGARVNRWEFRWDRIEPVRGQWSFAADDADVASSRQYDLALDGIIDGIPRWAVAPGQPPGNGVPKGLWRAPDDPRNLWAAFLRGLVSHYRGQVGYWEVWNEPDLKFFWNGTTRDYARLLRVAAAVIRATDPTARVMVAGMVVPDLAFAGQVLAGLRGHGTSPPPFDIAAWHAYGNAASLYTNLDHFAALLARNGFAGTPIWVTEDGFPAANPQGEPRQAAYILQTIAYAFAAGATHVLVYRASDDVTPKQWGVMAADGTPRSGYVAFQLAARYLSHAQAVVYDPSSRFERFVFYEPNRRVILFWNRSARDQPFSVSTGQQNGSLVDWLGQQTALTSVDAAWQGVAPGASYNQGIDPRNAVVGGPPVFLLEDDTMPSPVPVSSYIPSVAGSSRVLILVNAGDTTTTAQIAAADNPGIRQVAQIAPHSIVRIDLDLLAGPGYRGAYEVGAAAPLTALAASHSDTTADVRPSSDWYLAQAPATVSFVDVQPVATHVGVAAYGRWGQLLGRADLTIDPGSAVVWSPPGHPSSYALAAHSDVPVALADPRGQPLQTSVAPAPSWYILRPGKRSLALFNPGTAPLRISARFVGAPTVKAEQLRLAPLHSYVLATHAARAVTLEATGGTVVGYRTDAGAAPPQTAAVTSAGFAAAGVERHVVLFNPAAQPAHVNLTLVTLRGTTTITRTLQPLQTASVMARRRGGPPSGILVSSDLPVVAAAGP